MNARRGYNKLGKEYNNITGSFYNKYIERPAVKELLGSVRGKRVLDIGCGTGNHADMLCKLGAKVTGVDVSEEMVRISRERLPQCVFFRASMKKLPFKDSTFDVLLYGLSLHYEKNLLRVFAEARRVLKKGGRIVVSTHTPITKGSIPFLVNGKKYRSVEEYFSKKADFLNFEGVKLTVYSQTIAGLFNPLCENGFCLEKVIEPRPKPSTRKFDPEVYEKSLRRPAFIVFSARKV